MHLFSELSSQYIEIANYLRWLWKLYDVSIEDIFSDKMITSIQTSRQSLFLLNNVFGPNSEIIWKYIHALMLHLILYDTVDISICQWHYRICQWHCRICQWHYRICQLPVVIYHCLRLQTYSPLRHLITGEGFESELGTSWSDRVDDATDIVAYETEPTTMTFIDISNIYTTVFTHLTPPSCN